MVWVTSQINVLHAAAAATSFSMVIPADWARNVNSGERATVLRCRGQMTFGYEEASPAVSTQLNGVMISIGDIDAAGTGNWLANLALLEPEAPMFTYVWQSSNTTQTLGGTFAGHSHDLDTKSKRKFTTGEGVDCSVATAGVSGGHQDYRISVFMRTLLKVA